MKSRHARILALTTTVLSMAASLPAIAQESGFGDSDAIVVTARRVEERLQDVPISMTVFNQEAISSRNIFNAAELGAYTPSLSTNSRYGPEKASFAIRGFVQDLDTAPSVGVYFADVVAPRSGAATTGGNGVGVGAMFDLQNVQVLKGPQGTLFGRNTTGGAVLLVPQKPTDRLEGYVEGSLGNYDMQRVQAVLNLPLADTFKVRLGVDRMKRDGYLKNHSGIGPDRFADVDYISARLSIVADLTPDLENYTVASYTKSENSGVVPRLVGCYGQNGETTPPTGLQGFGAFYGCAQIARQEARGDGWWDVENSNPRPRLYSETWQVINTTTWQATDSLTVKNIVSYGEFRETSRFSLAGENYLNPFNPAATSPDLTLIIVGNTRGMNMGSQSTFTEELQFQGTSLDDRLTWQAGGYMEISDPLGYMGQNSPFLLNCPDWQSYQCYPNPALTIPLGNQTLFVANISQPWAKRWYRSKGLYAQGTYDFTEQLSLTAGLRYTWDSYRHYYAATGVGFSAPNAPVAFCNNPIANPGPDVAGGYPLKFITPGDFQQCGYKVSGKTDKPTWLIGLDYKPAGNILLYAKYARGYRAGGVQAAYAGYEQWGPEKADSYEVGAKVSLNGPVRGYFNLAGFYNDFSDQQIQATLNAKDGAPLLGGTAIINAGKSRIWGVEVDGSVTLFDSLRLDAGYTYLNSKLKSLTGVPIVDNRPWAPGDLPWRLVNPTSAAGGPLALSPKNRLTVTGTYTLPLDDSIGKLSVGATYVYTDRQVASQSTLPQWRYLPSTSLLNLNASWNEMLGAPVDLSFFMTNATNKKFPVAVTSSYPSFGIEAQMTNQPRMWGFRLKYRFGD